MTETNYNSMPWMENSKMQGEILRHNLSSLVFSSIYSAAENDMLKFMFTISGSDPSPNTPEHTLLSQSYFDHYLKQHLKSFLCSQTPVDEPAHSAQIHSSNTLDKDVVILFGY